MQAEPKLPMAAQIVSGPSAALELIAADSSDWRTEQPSRLMAKFVGVA